MLFTTKNVVKRKKKHINCYKLHLGNPFSNGRHLLISNLALSQGGLFSRDLAEGVI